MATPSTSNGSEVYVARQPILTARQQLYGYELLYRSSLRNAMDGVDSTTATSCVLANSYFLIGIDLLAAGRPAFINFDRQMLIDEYAELLPTRSVVVEILEDVEPDERVIAACRRLKQRRYMLALDDFTGERDARSLIELADIIKVDFRLTTPERRGDLARRYARRGIRMLAEKVETRQEFDEARRLGYELFQGYFFSRPTIVSARQVPGFKLAYLRIMKEITRPNLDLARLEESIKYEASLVYRLLRYMNSACFDWNGQISSVRHALTLLGEYEACKWITLAVLGSLAADKPHQLLVSAVIRGRFCELLSPWVAHARRGPELFLMGLFSLLDAVLDTPIERILEDFHLAGDVRAALANDGAGASPLRTALDLARAYEKADWQAVEALQASLHLPFRVASDAYLDAVSMAESLFR